MIKETYLQTENQEPRCACPVAWRCTAFDVTEGICIFTAQCSSNGSGQICKITLMPCPC
jgi:hypothetical protein